MASTADNNGSSNYDAVKSSAKLDVNSKAAKRLEAQEIDDLVSDFGYLFVNQPILLRCTDC